jgi:hypothetical protein
MIEINLLPKDLCTEAESPVSHGTGWALAWLSVLAVAAVTWFVRLEFRVADLRAEAAVEERYGGGGGPVGSQYGQLLLTVALCLPEDDVWIMAIDDSSGIVRIDLRAHNASALDRYVEQLGSHPAVLSLRVVRSWQPEAGGDARLIEAVFGGHERGLGAEGSA